LRDRLRARPAVLRRRPPGPRARLYRRTLHPDRPGFGAVGQFAAQGPFFPLLELQARWLVALWAGDVQPPAEAAMRNALAASPPPLEVHNVSRRRSPANSVWRPTCAPDRN
jgi:hypothetical protein